MVDKLNALQWNVQEIMARFGTRQNISQKNMKIKLYISTIGEVKFFW